jgi:hypothetical protein
MQIGEYVLENEDKVNRAINGTILDKGRLVGGVGEKAAPELILAEYDRLGGYITKDGLKVKTGSFYDFAKKEPKKEPTPLFEVGVEGEVIDMSEEDAKSLRKAKEQVAGVKTKKIKRRK